MVFSIENNAAGFLGISIQRDEKNQTIVLTQSRLIDRIIEALGLGDATGVEAPTEVAPLGKDQFGEEGNVAFNNLSSHSVPASQVTPKHHTKQHQNRLADT
eukprot:5302600-Ditylum_brightwellii.AAC.1